MTSAFIIIWGSKYVFRPVEGGWRGMLHCPQCGDGRSFVEKQPVKYFTIYWMPLFATSREASFIECEVCGGRFDRPDELDELPPSPDL